ncbi:MAG: MFS transporter [Spirochaetales bacterium]|nr:MFS transporter [Spirochaetales bacterium]
MAKLDTTVRPFSGKDEFGYVFGDMAGSFVNLFVDAYFLTFCTYALGINATWMAGLFLVARLWDAVNDPIIGSFPDRWHLGKSKDKFTPWIKLFMIPLALSGILCFSNVPFEGVLLHAYVAFAYILFGMSYTGTSMPFGAMANVVTQDPIQRSKLSRARSVGGGLVGAVALSMVPMICFDRDSNILPERFTLLAVIFGICSIVCYILLCTMTKERVREDVTAKEKFEYKTVLKAALKNRPLIGVMVATIGSMLTITGSSQTYSYIYKEVYNNTDMITLSTIAAMPFMVVVFPLIPKMVRKFGKRNVILYTSAFSFVISLIKIVFYIENVLLFTILNILTLLGQTAFTMLIWALVSDCLDYSEWKTGVRSDGSMYSLYTFSRKIGSTVASTGIAASLGLVGYVSGTNVVQTAEAVKGIYYVCNIIPALCYALCLIGIGLIFNLDKKKTDQMYQEMAERRSAAGN